jgi:DNA transposition AAA+ family ATPase
MSSSHSLRFIETLEYRRFHEFCDNCRRDRYIGLCYGPPGVGKTLSGLHYAKESRATLYDARYAREGKILNAVISSNVVLYTAKVLNSPGQIEKEIRSLRQTMHYTLLEKLRAERDQRLALVRENEERMKREFHAADGAVAVSTSNYCRTRPTFREVVDTYYQQCDEARDPTSLIIIDEADRLKMGSLEQVRDIFDHHGVGLVLIGMPGLHKRLARYPQLSSRVGFVHEFHPLNESGVNHLFLMGWRPPGLMLPDEFPPNVIAAILRVTGGNFRLLDRLLAQISRVLIINKLTEVTPEVVDFARENLVVG